MTEATRWTRRPEGSNWGEFGADDEIGRLNLITPALVRQAAEEIREGISFCLSLPLDFPGGSVLNDRRAPPRKFATLRDGEVNYNFALARHNSKLTDVICDDAVLLHTQYSTQWDALAHVGALFDVDGDGTAEPVYYNGWRGGEHMAVPADPEAPDGANAHRLGIEKMAETCVQGRGVMVDLRHHLGEERVLVGRRVLEEVLERDRVTVEPGDMLCLHTGFADAVLAMDRQPDADWLRTHFAVLDGQDARLLDWITDSGVSVIIADNYAVEQTARAPQCGAGPSLPLHQHCLFKLGIHLGELWHLGPLAGWLRAHGRQRFFLTAPPLRLPGAAGSPVTPVATV